MSVIADMMPSCEGGGYFFRYFSALIFLASLSYNEISFGSVEQEEEVVVPETPQAPPPPPPPSPEKKE